MTNDLPVGTERPSWTFSLPSGREVRVRPIAPEDKAALSSALSRMSKASRYRRFLSVRDRLSSAELRYLTEVDGHDHLAWVAADLATADGLGVARCVRLRHDGLVAEPAITVVDEAQGEGLGTLLFALLARGAVAVGIDVFRSEVLASNLAMRHLAGEFGSVERPASGGVVVLETPLHADPALYPDTPAGRVLREVQGRRDLPGGAG